MSATREDVRAAIERLSPDRTRWVGIDGFGGAGKSTLAAWLVARLHGATVVHVDDFSGPRFAEWDWSRMQAQLIDPVVAGRPARYQRWDWDADAGAEWFDLGSGGIVIIEGVSSTRRELDVRWDVTVWVDTPRTVRLARALERDGAALMPRWHTDWIPSELAYAERERPRDRVDFVVRGDVHDLGESRTP